MQKLHELVLSLHGEEEPAFEWRRIRRKGKTRFIGEPNLAMRSLHERIMRRLTFAASLILMHNAHGGVPGRSIITNAGMHVRSRYFYQLDIVDAFHSISIKRLAQVLSKTETGLGQSHEIEMFLRAYCAREQGGLATGGPASPLLFNIYCAVTIDEKLRKLYPEPLNIYTRFLDDLTISSGKPIPSIMRRRIREIVTDAGFEVSHRKSSVKDLHEQSVTVTGVTITREGTIRPTDKFMRELAAMLKVSSAKMNLQAERRFRGRVAFLAQFTQVLPEVPWADVTQDAHAMLRRSRRRIKRLDSFHSRSLFSYPRPAKIPWQFVEKVKKTAKIEEVAAWYSSKFRRRWNSARREYVGLSPFNREKHPSFTVAADKNFFCDFSSGKTGDVFDLIMQIEHVTFPQAVMIVATAYGIPMPKTEH